MPRLHHSPEITGRYSYGDYSWRVEAGYFAVDDEDVAAEVVANRNEITWADGAPDIEETPTPEPAETTFRCGVNDCSREVDSEDATCWQHS